MASWSTMVTEHTPRQKKSSVTTNCSSNTKPSPELTAEFISEELHRCRSGIGIRSLILINRHGVLISDRSGQVLPYALDGLSDRGKFFVKPGDEVYEGMVVGPKHPCTIRYKRRKL